MLLESKNLRAEIVPDAGANIKALEFKAREGDFLAVLEACSDAEFNAAPTAFGSALLHPPGRVSDDQHITVGPLRGKLAQARHGPLRHARFRSYAASGDWQFGAHTHIYENRPGFYPLDYTADVVVLLHVDELVQQVTITNCGATPLPSDLGHHSYFHCAPSDRALVTIPARRYWVVDEKSLPLASATIDDSHDFRYGREVDAVRERWDVTFDGLEGHPSIVTENGGAKLRIDLVGSVVEADGSKCRYNAAQLFVSSRNSIALELMSSCPDSVNLHAGDPTFPLRVLRQDQSVVYRIEFRVSLLGEPS